MVVCEPGRLAPLMHRRVIVHVAAEMTHSEDKAPKIHRTWHI
jgi:hypothetical protein